MFTPGDKLEFGHYTILKELGSGGMGIVYQCRDEHLKREVAVKMMLPELMSDSDVVEIFRQEARLAAQLEHPNIVTIHSIGMENREGKVHHYIAMELLPGGSLKGRIGKEKISLEEAVEWMKQLTAALSYAHKRGVVHQDIKPDNIFITQDGNVKIGDFGLALIATGPALERTESKGTPAYMSPELCRGEPRDHRSDIYSLGSVFYEMLTGERPYKASGMAEMAMKHTSAPIPTASKIRTETPPILDKVIKYMMAKSPDERLQSLNDVLPSLEKLLLEMKVVRLGVGGPKNKTVDSESSTSTAEAAGDSGLSDINSALAAAAAESAPSSKAATTTESKANTAAVSATESASAESKASGSAPGSAASESGKSETGSTATIDCSPAQGAAGAGSAAGGPAPVQKKIGPNGLEEDKERELDLIWTYKTGGPVGWFATPSLHRTRKHLYLPSADAVLYAIDMNSGKYVWHLQTGGPILASPLVVSDEVYCAGSDGNLYCISAIHGSVLWKHEGTSPAVAAPTNTADSVFVASLDGTIKSISRETGKLNWNYKCNGGIVSSPQVVEKTLFVASKDKGLHAIDCEKGFRKWHAEGSAPFFASVLASTDSVYCASADGKVYSFEIETGHPSWVYESNSAFLCKGNLEFTTLNYCAKNGAVHCLDKFKGTLIWRSDAAGPVLGGVSSVGGALYVGTRNGILHSFNVKTGELNWFHTFDSGLESAPLVTSTNLYQATISGDLHAFVAPAKTR